MVLFLGGQYIMSPHFEWMQAATPLKRIKLTPVVFTSFLGEVKRRRAGVTASLQQLSRRS